MEKVTFVYSPEESEAVASSYWGKALQSEGCLVYCLEVHAGKGSQ